MCRFVSAALQSGPPDDLMDIVRDFLAETDLLETDRVIRLFSDPRGASLSWPVLNLSSLLVVGSFHTAQADYRLRMRMQSLSQRYRVWNKRTAQLADRKLNRMPNWTTYLRAGLRNAPHVTVRKLPFGLADAS